MKESGREIMGGRVGDMEIELVYERDGVWLEEYILFIFYSSNSEIYYYSLRSHLLKINLPFI